VLSFGVLVAEQQAMLAGACTEAEAAVTVSGEVVGTVALTAKNQLQVVEVSLLGV
jgi:hypothetical protein